MRRLAIVLVIARPGGLYRLVVADEEPATRV